MRKGSNSSHGNNNVKYLSVDFNGLITLITVVVVVVHS